MELYLVKLKTLRALKSRNFMSAFPLSLQYSTSGIGLVDSSATRPPSASDHYTRVAFNVSRPSSATPYSAGLTAGSFGSSSNTSVLSRESLHSLFGPAPPMHTPMMKYSRHCPDYKVYEKHIGYNYNQNNYRVSFYRFREVT